MGKKALITGITGQDGSYLAESLLKKDYEVLGIQRRSSSFNTERINHIYETKNFDTIYGDLSDGSSIAHIIYNFNPDEIYNLGAQSHVRVSFDIPEYTTETIAMGTLRILETIRKSGRDIKFYQGSSSEMYGKVLEVPQNEDTPFNPRSPYACAKVFAHLTTKNYREAYNIFACNGILFNHECVSENNPIIIRDKKTKKISIKRIKDVRRVKEKGTNVQQWLPNELEIWDGTNFVNINCITATKRPKNNDLFNCKTINTRYGVVEVTNHHNMLDQNSSKVKAKEVQVGDKLLHNKFPDIQPFVSMTQQEAMFLGMLVADGYISQDGDGQFTNNTEEIINLMKSYWQRIALGYVRIRKYETEFGKATQMILQGNSAYLKMLRNEIYTYDGYKKIPDRILNSSKDVQLAFITGYNMCDGLKSNRCTYQFKNFKSNSIILAQGLIFLIQQTTKQDFNVTFEQDEKYYGYYSINLLSQVDNIEKEDIVISMLHDGQSQRSIQIQTGISRGFIGKISNGGHAEANHHLAKDKEEVKKFLYHDQQPGWVYDIETESGIFMCGLGTITVSNSPRRGGTFVTRKVVRGLIGIKLGKQKELMLGNLDAKRDWGYAKEYVEAMWKMLQMKSPDDYVIATGETHTVKEFVEECAKCLDIPLEWQGKGLNEVGINSKNNQVIIRLAERYFRPTEVDLLVGDASKAKNVLEWEPKVKFKELVKLMTEHELNTSDGQKS